MRFQPVEKLTIAFAALLTAAGLLVWPRLSDHASILKIALAGVVPLAVAAVRARWPRLPRPVGAVLDFHIIAPILLIFDNLGPLIRAVHPVDRDGWLAAADRLLLGTDAARLLDGLSTPGLGSALTFFYALYFFHPIVLAALVYADDLRALGRPGPRFARFGFLVVLAFYASYAGYFAVPAVGPRYTLAFSSPVVRGPVGDAIDRALDEAETNKRDVFPSGHTMVVTVVLIEAARRSRRTFLGFLFFAVPLYVATVYGRYHYLVDVLAGFALTPLVLWAGEAWLRGREPGLYAPDGTGRETIR
ncbi:MAG TPA: phosphatase PAP2 family protein [Thermoanaerobaculia bacterium]|nr:phosphatase PAP2 family protein [Thermoanaerobaculia bacterium]HQR66277.1 phosphatase PAP2 family protein [Thermoanaerobaculia bacterium]